MAPSSRRNRHLAETIAHLQLRLTPLVPLPSGPPHPAFPKTLMAFHLLTEDELDSIAHYYHQSTPGPWTDHYPANMNWDRELLARAHPKTEARPCRTSLPTEKRECADIVEGSELSIEVNERNDQNSDWLKELLKTVDDLSTSTTAQGSRPHDGNHDVTTTTVNPFVHLTQRQRILIKRRKLGKFIGLRGMGTPLDENCGSHYS